MECKYHIISDSWEKFLIYHITLQANWSGPTEMVLLDEFSAQQNMWISCL